MNSMKEIPNNFIGRNQLTLSEFETLKALGAYLFHIINLISSLLSANTSNYEHI